MLPANTRITFSAVLWETKPLVRHHIGNLCDVGHVPCRQEFFHQTLEEKKLPGRSVAARRSPDGPRFAQDPRKPRLAVFVQAGNPAPTETIVAECKLEPFSLVNATF